MARLQKKGSSKCDGHQSWTLYCQCVRYSKGFYRLDGMAWNPTKNVIEIFMPLGIGSR